MMPWAGGQFVYIQRAYGRLISALWLDRFTVIQTGVIAAIAVTFAAILLYFSSFRQYAYL
jgi:APA family basic amino acid/polyamine antiporter